MASKELNKITNHKPNSHTNFNSKKEKLSQSFTRLYCDICKSSDILETKDGYICRACGIVLEIQKLEYLKPYNSDIIQYAKLGTTQIDSVRDRFQNEKSIQLEKLNKIQSFKCNKEAVLERAKIEIKRIFTCLNLPQSLKDMVFKKFKKIHASLNPGTKYRTPEKLVPIVIYLIFKFQNISINEAKLLEISKISKKDFNTFKLQIINFFSQYQERDRKSYILRKFSEITEYFQLGMVFYFQCKKILFKLWDNINDTKDDLIAGLIASISLLCSFKDKNVSVSSICKNLGIKTSTIQLKVNKRIFDKFKLYGFTTFIKSTDLLRRVMEKMSIIEVKQISIEKKNSRKTKIQSNIIELKLGSVKQEPNYLNNIDYYFYSLRNNNGFPQYFSLKCFNNSIVFDNKKLINSYNAYNLRGEEDLLFELEILKFLKNKDLPNFQ